MSNLNANIEQTQGRNVSDVSPDATESSAFLGQLESFSQPHTSQNVSAYAQSQPFDMGSLGSALPPPGQVPIAANAPFTRPNASIFQMQPGMPINASSAGRGQHPQYFGPQYGPMSPQPPMMPRHALPHGPYAQMDPYGLGMNPMSPIDPRLGHHSQYMMTSNIGGDYAQYGTRASEPAPVPTFPRGPPRKPKQSGHALWVGNLPPNATVTDLKDHFSRDATKDIESLFLISKSNCAFVNYRSEAACIAAMNRFHDSRFHGVRLVCRLRRGAPAGSSPSTTPTADTPDGSIDSLAGPATPSVTEEPTSPTIVGSSHIPASSTQQVSHPTPTAASQKVSEKFFIVKSLTAQDLEASVRNGIWATQSHNESVLNKAHEEADNVYLIFSANKSGEYFGYARMTSTISGEPVNLSTMFPQVEAASPGAPQSIPTPATTTAPRGRIIDDSARGTIFWEAEHSDDGDDESSEKDGGGNMSGQNWGRQFAIEWLSTSRLPFYRTRGLRNPWNANREVKIARDGTELEPSVGRRLVQMFHRPSPGPSASQPGAPLR